MLICEASCWPHYSRDVGPRPHSHHCYHIMWGRSRTTVTTSCVSHDCNHIMWVMTVTHCVSQDCNHIMWVRTVTTSHEAGLWLHSYLEAKLWPQIYNNPLTPTVIWKLLEIIGRVRLCPSCSFATALDSDINQTTGSGGHLSMWENRCMHAAVCLLRAGQPRSASDAAKLGQFILWIDPIHTMNWHACDPRELTYEFHRSILVGHRRPNRRQGVKTFGCILNCKCWNFLYICSSVGHVGSSIYEESRFTALEHIFDVQLIDVSERATVANLFNKLKLKSFSAQTITGNISRSWSTPWTTSEVCYSWNLLTVAYLRHWKLIRIKGIDLMIIHCNGSFDQAIDHAL